MQLNCKQMAVKPNKESIITEMMHEIEKGANYTSIVALLCPKLHLSKRTITNYWNIAQSRYSELSSSINKQLEIDSIDAAKERLKEGLKSKSERLLNLQNQVDELKLEIERNIMHFHSFADGEIITGVRTMNSLERAKISEVIKSIQAEISKIEGDYAAVKQDLTTKGESLNSAEIEKQRFEELLNAAREGIRKD